MNIDGTYFRVRLLHVGVEALMVEHDVDGPARNTSTRHRSARVPQQARNKEVLQ